MNQGQACLPLVHNFYRDNILGLRHRHNYESVASSLKSSELHYSECSFAGTISVALIYPNLYSLGMSNLGFMTVHRLAASVAGTGVERFFPALEAETPLPPPYYSFETGRPLGDFNVLMFSFSYEGDFDKIPGLFSSLGLPVLSSERNPHHPLLIAGGAAIASNPAALSRIFDVLVPGEAESTVVPILQQLHREGFDPEALARLPGVWVPAVVQVPPGLHGMHDVNAQPAWSHIVAEHNAFGGAHIIEVMRGCPRACSFCLARCIYAPVRPVSAASVEKWLDAHPTCRDLGLVAPSLFDHPEVEAIFAMLTDRGIRIRNSSVKWEKLGPEIIDALRSSGITSLTIAPETGSERLRREMRKPLDEARFLERIRELFAQGFEHVKMYFVACLPGEQPEDIDATLDFIRRVSGVVPPGASISAAFSIFVPKNHTPWQNMLAPDLQTIKRSLKHTREGLSRFAGPIRVTYESPQEALRQAVLSRVGPELADEYAMEARKCRENRLFARNQFTALEF